MRKMGKLFLVLLLAGTLGACQSKEMDTGKKETTSKTEEKKPDKDVNVSFLAVGDNLIHNSLYLDSTYKTENGWDFTSMYENTNQYTQNVDIANINQETILGGTELELSNYPMFNGPHEIADAVAAAGFDWVVHASNHSLDRGEAGIVSDRNYWDKFKDITVTGINRSQKEADAAVILERKGIKFGLLNYTYGTNGIALPKGKEYLVNLIDKEKMKKDIQKLKKQSDVIVVSMHWGEEYSFTPNEEQAELAQFLADQGVQVIVGSHPHVIQPMEYIKGKDGNKTLVIYSLGNFISAQVEDYQMLGGMARWNIVKKAKTGKYEVTDAEFWPMVTFYRHDGSGNMVGFKTYALKDYTDDIASQHGLAPAVSRQYFIDKSKEVLGTMDNIKIVYKQEVAMRKVIAQNRKASHDYYLEERFEAGLVLMGTEIKSIRGGHVQLKDSYVSFIDNEAYIKEMHISAYDHGNRFNHDETRVRKLLLHRDEIKKLQQKVKLKGYTIVPTQIYLDKGMAKMEIALAKGKDLHDKRNVQKEKDAQREIAKVLKNRY